MQREIKFRAWNIKEERMIQNIQQEYDGKEEDCFAQFIEQEANHGRSGEKGKYHVMQYTGLKDKNGVEIYEGDILEYIDPNNILRKSNVEYVAPKFQAMTAPQNNMPIYDVIGMSLSDAVHPWRKIEIVGNIFEGVYK